MAGRVAVIIPTFNRAREIGRAVESVVAQTAPVHEIVVVDDGSTDDTREVVEALARRQPTTIRLLSTSGRTGAPNARNTGARATDAEILAFLDSDDAWLPTKLERQLSLLDAGAGFVASGTGFRKVDQRGRTLIEVMPPPTVTLRDLVSFNLVGPSSVLVLPRQVFETAGGFDTAMRSCQDWDLYGRILEAGMIGVVQDILVEQDVGSANRISNGSERVVWGHREMMARMSAHAPALGLDASALDRAQGAAMVDLFLRLGDYRAAASETLRRPSLRAGAKWVRAALALGRRSYH